jgi:hypothetical protein
MSKADRWNRLPLVGFVLWLAPYRIELIYNEVTLKQTLGL